MIDGVLGLTPTAFCQSIEYLNKCGCSQLFLSHGSSRSPHDVDWLGLLVDREPTHRRDKRLAARLRYARLRQRASIEDVLAVGADGAAPDLTIMAAQAVATFARCQIPEDHRLIVRSR
jgi:hypothetical protein